MPESREDAGRPPAYRLSRVLVRTQIILALPALVAILVTGATRHPAMWRGLEAGIIRSSIVLICGVLLLWSIRPGPGSRRLPATVLLLVPGAVDLVTSLPSLSATARASASALAAVHHAGSGVPSGNVVDLYVGVLHPSGSHALTEMISEWSGPLVQAAIAVALIHALLLHRPGRPHADRWLRIPLWTCAALGAAALALAALVARLTPGMPLAPPHDTARYAVPTLAMVLLALPLVDRSTGWIRRCVPAVLLVPALWYAWTRIGGLLEPPAPSSPSHAAPGGPTSPGPDEIEAAWRLGAAAWQTVRLAIALSVTTAALALIAEFLRRHRYQEPRQNR